MKVTAFSQDLIPQVQHIMELGAPYVRVRTESDYWLYAHLFSSSCPIGMVGDQAAGAVIAFRSQDDPSDVYVQDVVTHPDHRGRGVARKLLTTIQNRAAEWGCTRIYLTSEPENTAAHSAWTSMGFINLEGDTLVNDVSVTKDFKGPGKDRAVYELKVG